MNRAEREMLEDDRHNVFRSPDNFRGWHVATCALWKRGVYRFEVIRWIGNGAEKLIGFCRQDVMRVAIEQKICPGAK